MTITSLFNKELNISNKELNITNVRDTMMLPDSGSSFLSPGSSAVSSGPYDLFVK